MGRFSVEIIIANNREVLSTEPGDPLPDSVRHLRLQGAVDTGAARLVLPESTAAELDLVPAGESRVRYADQRMGTRRMVSNVWLKLLGRDGVFSAILEPDRTTALIGAIVLEELDLVVDCVTNTLHPRDPDRIVSEIE